MEIKDLKILKTETYKEDDTHYLRIIGVNTEGLIFIEDHQICCRYGILNSIYPAAGDVSTIKYTEEMDWETELEKEMNNFFPTS